MMSAIDVYKKVKGEVQSLYRSRLQMLILLSLHDGDKTLSQLRDITGSTSQALIPKIRVLESLKFIESKNYLYSLTPIGRIVTDKIRDFVLTIGAISRHQEFWASHDLSGIPEEFLMKIRDLIRAESMYDSTTDIHRVYEHYVRILKESEYVLGISSVMSPGLAQLLAERVIEGVSVDLIVNPDVIAQLKQDPYAAQIRNLSQYKNFKVWCTREPLKVGLTVTDKYLSLGLYKEDGKLYDSSMDLFSSDPEAVQWAHDLFRYYQERSVLLPL
jgi:predicted transcriptional regulator